MTLSARDRRALDSIGDRLSGTDPHLASLLGTFTRLTAGEDMPVREQIRRWRPAVGARRGLREDRSGKCATRPRAWAGLGLGGAITLAWVLTTVAMIAAAIVISTNAADSTCRATWAMSCTGPARGASSHSGRP